MDTQTLKGPTITTLAPDPPSTYRLNANSFQQHALTTAFGWQYAAFYTASSSTTTTTTTTSSSSAAAAQPHAPRHITLARRRLPSSHSVPFTAAAAAAAGPWRHLPLPKLTQATEDGHNTVSMGVSEGDGRVHLAWDCHSDEMRYVSSVVGLAWCDDADDEEAGGEGESGGTGTGTGLWCEASFCEVDEMRRGEAGRGTGDGGDVGGRGEGGGEDEDGKERRVADGGLKRLLRGCEVTYPRFRGLPGGMLLFECRVGRAGAGDAVVCRYERLKGLGSGKGEGEDGEGQDWAWRWLGCYLRGWDCSPYVNGVSWDGIRGRLWVTWTNRRYTEKQREGEGQGKAVQAGPNGPENNEDLGCLWSGDLGQSWCVDTTGEGSVGEMVAGEMKGMGPVSSREERVIVKRIPKGSGIMNQEGQCVDSSGRVHVLMRDDSTGGKNVWKHHWRVNDTGTWLTEAVPSLRPTGTGSRGKVCCVSGDLYFVIPGNVDTSLTVLRRSIVVRGARKHDGEGEDGQYGPFDVVWQGMGFDGEPLIDEERLCSGDRTLSVMTRTAAGLIYAEAMVVVLDWDLRDS